MSYPSFFLRLVQKLQISPNHLFLSSLNCKKKNIIWLWYYIFHNQTCMHYIPLHFWLFLTWQPYAYQQALHQQYTPKNKMHPYTAGCSENISSHLSLLCVLQLTAIYRYRYSPLFYCHCLTIKVAVNQMVNLPR